MNASISTSSDVMPIQGLDDWDRRLARHDAFWDRACIDRPVAVIRIPKTCPPEFHVPEKRFASHRERWFDAEYVAQKALENVMSFEYLGDALPFAWPNLGPEVFSAYFGLELEYGPRTAWSVPNLRDWAKTEELVFSEDNFYWRKTLELTETLLEIGRGRFYTGLTDLHPGADALAAFRDPQTLNLDLLDFPDDVSRLLDHVTETFFDVYDRLHEKLQAAGQVQTTWIGMFSTRRFYVPSNDFSCMISKRMFDEFFLPGLASECRHLDVSIYHLDGPGALRHLDSLLRIEELNAIQWVYGAGNGKASDWLHVYRRCQDAGKGVQVGIHINELDTILENLKPEGLWLSIHGVKGRAQAAEVLKRLERTCRG